MDGLAALALAGATASSRPHLLPPPMSQTGLLAGPCLLQPGEGDAPCPPRGWQGFREPGLPSSPEDQPAPGAEPWAQAVFVTLERSRPWGQGPPWAGGPAGHHPHLLGQQTGHPTTWRDIPSLPQLSPAPQLHSPTAGTHEHLLCACAVLATSPGLPASALAPPPGSVPCPPHGPGRAQAPLRSPGLVWLLQLHASPRRGPARACPRARARAGCCPSSAQS